MTLDETQRTRGLRIDEQSPQQSGALRGLKPDARCFVWVDRVEGTDGWTVGQPCLSATCATAFVEDTIMWMVLKNPLVTDQWVISAAVGRVCSYSARVHSVVPTARSLYQSISRRPVSSALRLLHKTHLVCIHAVQAGAKGTPDPGSGSRNAASAVSDVEHWQGGKHPILHVCRSTRQTRCLLQVGKHVRICDKHMMPSRGP